MLRTKEQIAALNAQKQVSKTVLDELEQIFLGEFSTVAKATLATSYAGLRELISLGQYDAARTLVNGITTPPPGITTERMEEVKTLILSKLPS